MEKRSPGSIFHAQGPVEQLHFSLLQICRCISEEPVGIFHVQAENDESPQGAKAAPSGEEKTVEIETVHGTANRHACQQDSNEIFCHAMLCYVMPHDAPCCHCVPPINVMTLASSHGSALDRTLELGLDTLADEELQVSRPRDCITFSSSKRSRLRRHTSQQLSTAPRRISLLSSRPSMILAVQNGRYLEVWFRMTGKTSSCC